MEYGDKRRREEPWSVIDSHVQNGTTPLSALRREPKRILVFRTGHLGDTIIALPAFHAIREAYPEGHITLLCNANAKSPDRVAARSVLPSTGLIDDWLTYEDGLGAFKAAVSLASLLRTLRSRRFDALFYLMTRNRSAKRIKRDRLFFRAAGITTMIGDSYLLSRPINSAMAKPLPSLRRESEFLLDLLAAEGIPASSRSSDMLLSESEVERADTWLAETCGHDFRDKKLLALAPGSGWESKVWKEEHFIEVTRHLIDRHSALPIIYGGPEERPMGDRFVAALGSGANSAGKLNVREGAAAMRHARLYLGNDTGSMHMAAAVGLPCVAIFAAIDFPGRWEPIGDGHRVFRAAVECEGCYTPDCFNRHKCLEEIRPEQVLSACDEFLAR